MKTLRMWLWCALLAGVASGALACGKTPDGAAPPPTAVAPLQPATIAVPGAEVAAIPPVAADPGVAVPVQAVDAPAQVIPPSKIPSANAAPLGQAPAAPGGAEAAPATLGDPMFSLRLTAAPTVAPGGTAKALVTVMPGKGYKVNKEFPANLQMEALPGVTFSPPRQERAAATVDTDHELTFEVQMAAAAAGDYAAKGLLKFAVCDDANCVPKKQAFAVDLHVK